jgi:hypothetical protein
MFCEPMPKVKGKTCTSCGCFHPNEAQDNQQGKGESKPSKGKPSKGSGQGGGKQTDLEKAQEKMAAASDKAAEKSEESKQKLAEFAKKHASGKDGEKEKKDYQKALNEACAANSGVRKAEVDAFKQFEREGIGNPSGSYGTEDRYRIGIACFDVEDLTPDPVPPMTKQEFKERIQKRLHRAVDAKVGDLDERRMVDAVSGNDMYPWENLITEPLSDVHIIICVDNSCSMQESMGHTDRTSKAVGTAEAVSIICTVADELNESAGEGGRFYTTFIKWSTQRPEVVKTRDDHMTKDEVVSNYMSHFTSCTYIEPLIPVIEQIPVRHNETCLVLILTDGAMAGEDALVEAMTGSERLWALFGVGCMSPLFDRVCWQAHEIQQTLFDSILDAVDRAWGL